MTNKDNPIKWLRTHKLYYKHGIHRWFRWRFTWRLTIEHIGHNGENTGMFFSVIWKGKTAYERKTS